MGLENKGENEDEAGKFKSQQPDWMNFRAEEEGLLNVPKETEADNAQTQWMREHHNASHALWYFSMIVYAIIHDKPSQNTRHKTERILAHLSHLREFINEKDHRGKKIVTHLFDSLLSERPDSHEKWVRFIYAHWNLIWSFAECYGHQEKCFPESDFKCISDLIHQRHYWKLWWWKMQLKNFFRPIRLTLKSGVKKA